MSKEKKIATKCNDCGTELVFDDLKSIYFCKNCYKPYGIHNIWCPYCGNNEFTKYSSPDRYFCNICKKFYKLWDSSLINSRLEKRLDTLEKRNEMFEKLLLEMMKEGGLTPKQQGIIQKIVIDKNLRLNLLNVDKCDSYLKLFY